MKKTHVLFRLIPLVVVVALLVVAMGVTSLHVGAASPSPVVQGKARFVNMKLHQLGSTSTNAALRRPAASSLPTWSSSFTYQGQSYPYTMIGTNPRSGSKTSTVPVDIIPLIFKFSDGTSLNGGTITSSLTGSALFKNASFATGTTQYFDAFRRAEFWKTVSTSSPSYHVLLGTPSVKKAVTLSVPSASGSTKIVSGQRIGYVSIDWFSPKADQLAVSNGAAGHLVILAAVNVYQYQGSPSSGCCIGGYHTAVQSGGSNYTYAYAGWDKTGKVFHDIEAMSHEVAEWGDDPLTNNTTPNWYASNYGCSNSLEVGDPAVGTYFKVGGLNFQDEVFFSWFARENPSQGYQGRYDYLGTLFNGPATGC